MAFLHAYLLTGDGFLRVKAIWTGYGGGKTLNEWTSTDQWKHLEKGKRPTALDRTKISAGKYNNNPACQKTRRHTRHGNASVLNGWGDASAQKRKLSAPRGMRMNRCAKSACCPLSVAARDGEAREKGMKNEYYALWNTTALVKCWRAPNAMRWHWVHGDRPMFSEIVPNSCSSRFDDLTLDRLRGERTGPSPPIW